MVCCFERGDVTLTFALKIIAVSVCFGHYYILFILCYYTTLSTMAGVRF